MTEIHYFPRYAQRENFVTNNTLLLLLRLYQYNRFKFEKFMETLCSDHDVQLTSSWLSFRQQERTTKSVVDGFIAQESVKIAVETKLGDGFDLVQLRSHLTAFRDEQHKLLVLLNPSGEAGSPALLKAIRDEAAARNVQILLTSFDEIITNAQDCLSEHDEEMLALVDDYQAFCSEMDLLPRDRYTVFVPPCGQSFDENIEYALYYCPASWTRRKAAYLGVYARKAVRAVGRIVRVVTCDVDLEHGAVSQTGEAKAALSRDEERRILGASQRARRHGWDVQVGHKFYLCDGLVETDFQKTSPGGIMGHRYFDLGKVLDQKVPEQVADIAALLRSHTWT